MADILKTNRFTENLNNDDITQYLTCNDECKSEKCHQNNSIDMD